MADKTVLESLRGRLHKLETERCVLTDRMRSDAVTVTHIDDDLHWTRRTIQDEEDRAKS